MSDEGQLETLMFMYRNAVGELKARELVRWRESGRYIKGFSIGDDKVLTFRKDRVVEYFDGTDALLLSPISEPPPKLMPAFGQTGLSAADDRPQILFTGFTKDRRSQLERDAEAVGLRVVSSVTKTLMFLCCGMNAGPMKTEKARDQGVFIVDELQVLALFETGELPDSLI